MPTNRQVRRRERRPTEVSDALVDLIEGRDWRAGLGDQPIPEDVLDYRYFADAVERARLQELVRGRSRPRRRPRTDRSGKNREN